MATLRSVFNFGKWKSIYKDEGDYAGRTIIQRSDYSFKLHQAKFIKERLKVIDMAKGRKSMKKDPITPGERTQLRAVLGGINWLQRETRPDQAGNASIGMSRILKATVQDLCDANISVAQVKADPYLGIIIPSIPISEIKWATIQDASFANGEDNRSQAGFLVGATTQAMWENLPAPFAVLSSIKKSPIFKCLL